MIPPPPSHLRCKYPLTFLVKDIKINELKIYSSKGKSDYYHSLNLPLTDLSSFSKDNVVTF